MEGLIERIRENKLDALYLFINESLRNRTEFDVFYQHLLDVLPNNWSINRVEIGHEFLSMISNSHPPIFNNVIEEGRAEVDEGEEVEEAVGPNMNNHNTSHDNNQQQDELFHWVCSLESLRSLIISDGYIPRKDHGFCHTKSLLKNLPLAKNLSYLDIQRLHLQNTPTGDDNEEEEDMDDDDDAELLADSLESLTDSLEDIRITSITICYKNESNNSNTPRKQQHYPLDAAIRVCGEMANLQLLAISCADGCGCNDDDVDTDTNDDDDDAEVVGGNVNGNDGDNDNDNDNNNIAEHPEDGGVGVGGDVGNEQPQSSTTTPSTSDRKNRCLISNEAVLELCRSSTTLQELALRSMNIDDTMCQTIAKAFDPPKNQNTTTTTTRYTPHATTNTASTATATKQQQPIPGSHYSSSMVSAAAASSLLSSSLASASASSSSPSFWTSLDLRQNPAIGTQGYEAILASLERNYDIWCSLMVDNQAFQSKFNALIELNQANRGALVRSPTVDKFATFVERLNQMNNTQPPQSTNTNTAATTTTTTTSIGTNNRNHHTTATATDNNDTTDHDPTSLWYFLTIHRNTILHPYIRYMKFKNRIVQQRKRHEEEQAAAAVAAVGSGRPDGKVLVEETAIDGRDVVDTKSNNNTIVVSSSLSSSSKQQQQQEEQQQKYCRTDERQQHEQQPDLKRYKKSS